MLITESTPWTLNIAQEYSEALKSAHKHLWALLSTEKYCAKALWVVMAPWHQALERFVLDPKTLIEESVFMEIRPKQNCPISEFLAKEKKVWQSKIWDDSVIAFSVPFVVVYFVFSLCATFTEKFTNHNRLFWKLAKFGPLMIVFSFFLPIFSAPPSCLFWTPKLWSGTQNEDFQRS